MSKQVGARIRQLRKDKLRMDQNTLADHLGVSHGAISYWERGGNATLANLRRLAQLGGVTLDYLQSGIVDDDAAAEAIPHPRWTLLEGRLKSMREDVVDEMLSAFEDLLDRRDRWVEQERKRFRDSQNNLQK